MKDRRENSKVCLGKTWDTHPDYTWLQLSPLERSGLRYSSTLCWGPSLSVPHDGSVLQHRQICSSGIVWMTVDTTEGICSISFHNLEADVDQKIPEEGQEAMQNEALPEKEATWCVVVVIVLAILWKVDLLLKESWGPAQESLFSLVALVKFQSRSGVSLAEWLWNVSL